MAYNIYLERSSDGTTWTTVTSWVTNGGTFADWVSETPNTTGSPITYTYRFKISSTDSGDLAGPRRLAGIAGNR